MTRLASPERPAERKPSREPSHRRRAARGVGRGARTAARGRTAGRQTALAWWALAPCALALTTVAAVAGVDAPARGQEAPDDPAPSVVPVRFSVAPSAGTLGPDGQPRTAPAAIDAFLDAQVAHANAIFAPYGVAFRETTPRAPLDARHAVLDTRADRHALGPLVAPGVANVFVVAYLRDVDDPSRSRSGVHWRARGPGGARATRLVVLAGYADPRVLAHELGHFLGLRPHSDVPGNLMSYAWGAGLPVLDAAQARRVRRAARAMAITGG